MTLKQNRTGQLLSCSILLGLNLLFIWGNSALPAEISGKISASLSTFLARLVNHLFPIGITPSGGGAYLLRKLAHFAEFAWLGLCLTWLSDILSQQGIHRLTMPAFFGLLTAVVDETIQIFSQGRSSSLVDVWIDTAGVCVGIVVWFFCYAILASDKKIFPTKEKQS